VLPVRLHDRAVKTVLRKSRLVDPWFVGKYSFSPYQACAHGCRYCDGRAERYWVDGEFDRDIVVRRNAADVLAREVPKLRERGIVFVGSGISDVYQPPEADERLMPACGRVLADHRLPVTILTKSSLIVRDLGLWSEANVTAGFVLMESLVTLDDGLRAIVEPGASPVEARLETLRAFKARGCGVGAAAMPLLPFLTDGDAELDVLARALGQVGVDFVLVGGLTLRPGRQKAAFFDTLRRSFADLLPHYERLYGEDRPSGAPRREYGEDAQRRAEAAFTRAGLVTVLPHRLYQGRLPVYDEVDVLLQQIRRHYARHADALRRLEGPRRRYREWLLSRKDALARRRSLREADLTAELTALAASREWPAWLGSRKLAAFLREVIIDRRVFDERMRRLRDSPVEPVPLAADAPATVSDR
jgi:DNA repair photolyase